MFRRVRDESHAGPARGSRPGRPIHGRARDSCVRRGHRAASRLDGLRVPDDRARPRGRHRAERPFARWGSAPRRWLGLQRGRRPSRGGAGDRARHASGKRRARHALRRRAAASRDWRRGDRRGSAGGPHHDRHRLAPARGSAERSRRLDRLQRVRRGCDRRDGRGRDVVCDRAHVSIDVVSELADAVRHAWDAR